VDIHWADQRLIKRYDEGSAVMPDCVFCSIQEYDGRIDGVWNLVLACSTCNGPTGKWDRAPDKPLLERLKRRNDFLIASNHPLRETLLGQLGATESARSAFLNNFYDSYASLLGAPWVPTPKAEPAF
jgi:hypothetical protein